MAPPLSGCVADDPDAEIAGSSSELRRSRGAAKTLMLKPGESVAFLLTGPQYRALESLRATGMRPADSSKTRSRQAPIAKPSSFLSAKLGKATRQGIWVRVDAAKRAPRGTYWLEGMSAASKGPLMALPVLLEVVSTRTRLRTTAQLPTAADVMRIDSGRLPVAETPYVTTRPLHGSLQPVEPYCQLDSATVALVLSQGGSLPCESNVSIGVPSGTTITSHAPMAGAEVGGKLVIRGHHLPAADGVIVSLDGQELELVSASSTRIELVLPSQAAHGRLVVQRPNGDVLGVLSESYQVGEPPSTLFDDFTGTQTQTSLKLGYQMAMLSWLAYTDDLRDALIDNTNFYQHLGVSVVRELDVTREGLDCAVGAGGVQAVLFRHEPSDSIIVALRGSQTNANAIDWRKDLDPRPWMPANWPAGSIVHCGFHQYARLALDSLRDDLQKYSDDGTKIWITGHSLGGASAMLLAAMLEWEEQIEITGVYTYGAPGIGSLGFVSAYDADVPNTHRYETDFDPAVSLYHPHYLRPGKNHLLFVFGLAVLNSDAGFPAYPGLNGQQFIDLMGVHMDYWCRIFGHLDTTVAEQLSDSMIVPPSLDGTGVCTVSDF